MSEYFLQDGSYRENDGANEADVRKYSFAGNTFCVRSWEHKADLCRSVLIDSRKRKWLITDSEKLGATQVIIKPIASRR